MPTGFRRAGLGYSATALLACAGMGCGGPAASDRPGPDSFIGGQVVGEDGSPEAGVWVIAESTDVMSSDGRSFDVFRKIVVTNDEGRFVVPELPEGRYDVWVRGYGLLDSKPSWNRPGSYPASPGTRDLSIRVQRAPTPREASRVYPASYWFSLLELPQADHFPGGGDGGIGGAMESQAQWMGDLKLGCALCHQMGAAATRLPSQEAFDVGIRKVARMAVAANRFGYPSLSGALGNWGERIRDGAVPPAPERPEGLERNLVITQWEIGDPVSFMHDLSTTDRRNPSVNAGGPIYVIDEGQDWLFILDPVRHTWERKRVPIHPDGEQIQEYFGLGDPTWDGHSTFAGAYAHGSSRPHNPMLDDQGRVWLTTGTNGGLRPDFCPEDATVTSFTMYDPETDAFEVIPTCFWTHHLEFDADGVLWSCDLGWFDPGAYDPDDPSSLERAQGWTRRAVDSNGDGVADTPLPTRSYGIYPSPDGSIWNTRPSPFPGSLNYYDPGTDTHEVFSAPGHAHGPRGVTVDSNGIVWTAFAGSGHLGRFDRSRCGQTWGLGDQCPEGWTLWKTPGPTFQGFEPRGPEDNANADMHYYVWVDRQNASGLGENVVIVNGTNSDSQLIFHPESEEWTTLRVPYPLGYYTRLVDARIDDPDAGWKGRGLWSNYSSMSLLHTETRRAAVVRMQLRPDPLAR